MTAFSHTPTENEVNTVRYMLCDFLPLELVDIIIEDAEYWPCLYSKQDLKIKVEASKAPGPAFKSAWCYLISSPIPGIVSQESSEPESIARKVVFEIQSHDQGWGIHPGPWSWFEAIIIREQPIVVPPAWLNAALHKPVDLREGIGFDQLFTGPQPNTTRWHICSNRVAVRTKQDHCIVWTQHAEIGGNKDAKSPKGREGFGHELLKALQPGDRIAILALAEQWRWENHVYSGSVKIYYSA
ncbi:hypothetical protein BT96DRAFT_813259 [Gymnopus androsaceus JB14]|uniref:Uncharacterized protein n=1 Tax=Gymnopus androsaceus JB14 TaxID=1447944 RepID=A0A6A4I2Q6_9AGAR|nr:hypothetical protein BT96DRAFT_813259 [Gymnopus androsaceus JB14]